MDGKREKEEVTGVLPRMRTVGQTRDEEHMHAYCKKHTVVSQRGTHGNDARHMSERRKSESGVLRAAFLPEISFSM